MAAKKNTTMSSMKDKTEAAWVALASDPTTDPATLKTIATQRSLSSVRTAALLNPNLPTETCLDEMAKGTLEVWANPQIPFLLLTAEADAIHRGATAALAEVAQRGALPKTAAFARMKPYLPVLRETLVPTLEGWWTSTTSVRAMLEHAAMVALSEGVASEANRRLVGQILALSSPYLVFDKRLGAKAERVKKGLATWVETGKPSADLVQGQQFAQHAESAAQRSDNATTDESAEAWEAESDRCSLLANLTDFTDAGAHSGMVRDLEMFLVALAARPLRADPLGVPTAEEELQAGAMLAREFRALVPAPPLPLVLTRG